MGYLLGIRGLFFQKLNFPTIGEDLNCILTGRKKGVLVSIINGDLYSAIWNFEMVLQIDISFENDIWSSVFKYDLLFLCNWKWRFAWLNKFKNKFGESET